MTWRHVAGAAAGMTLLEVMTAITISGLVVVAVLTSLRIGTRAWEKGQSTVLQLRRQTNAADIVHLQLSDYLLRNVTVELFDRRQKMTFFFGQPDRLVFLTSYSALQRGRGGIVAADYFAEPQPDRTWKLWLDEHPALDDEALSKWVEGIEAVPEGGQKVRLRTFDTRQALLLWEGLSECNFEYLREMPPPIEWVSPWSLLSSPYLPSAIRLNLGADALRWKGLTPAPVFARLSIGGASR